MAREDVVREVANLSKGRAGDLRIGAHPGVVDDLLAPACSALLKEAPKVTLTVAIEAPDSALIALREGKLDLIVSGVSATSHEGLVHQPLLEDVVVVFASADHQLAKRKRLRMADLLRERWAVTAYSASGSGWPQVHRAFEGNGLPPPTIVAKTTSLSLRNHLVASTDLLGASSRRVLQQSAERLRLVELPVKEFTVTRNIGVSYRKDACLSPAARRFIEILKKTAKEIAAPEQ